MCEVAWQGLLAIGERRHLNLAHPLAVQTRAFRPQPQAARIRLGGIMLAMSHGPV